MVPKSPGNISQKNGVPEVCLKNVLILPMLLDISVNLLRFLLEGVTPGGAQILCLCLQSGITPDRNQIYVGCVQDKCTRYVLSL